MARRSPTNERYQKYTGPKGQTRKSAAAAKPKKSSSSSGSGSSATKSKRPGLPKLAPKMPMTPEFKKVRRMWWISLIVGLVLTTASWALRAYIHTAWATTAATITLGLAYTAIFFALYIDWTKMRPMRQAHYGTGKYAKSDKDSGKK